MTLRLSVLSLALALTSCAADLPGRSFAGRSPEMRPERFFAGTTRSFGVLETRSGAPQQLFHVEGHGAAGPEGFRLDQTVVFDGKPPQHRTWLMRPTGPHSYRATLSDAGGRVTAEAYGDLFHLSYRLKIPLGRMEQWLYLQPDGRTVLNEATVTVAGVVAARLSERITREDAADAGP